MMKQDVKPEVGMGCTECLWSDTHAGTISRISESGKTIWYKRDLAKIVKGSARDGSAVYEYESNEWTTESKATLRKNGQFRETGTNNLVIIGYRREHYDPSF